MSWQTALAQTYDNCADFLEDATNGLYKKMVDAGWTLHDDLVATSGQTDKVYKSVGEDGTEAIYIRITQTSGTQRIRFGCYSYWDASGHAGYNEVRGGLSYNSHSDYPHCCGTLATSFIGWIVASKDGVTFCHKLSTRYSMGYFGVIKNRSIHTAHSGRTTLSSGVTIAASGTTNLSVVSETNIEVGRKIWVINQATTAGGTMLRCTVTATASGQVTVTNDAGVATAFDTGALVGYDPQPVAIPIGYYSDSAYDRSCPQKGYSTLYKMSDTRKTGSAQSYTNAPRFANHYPFYDYHIGQTWPNNGIDTNMSGNMRSRFDPDIHGRFVLYPYSFLDGWTDSTTPVTEGAFRGYVDRICWVPKGTTIANEDTVSVGSAQWVVMDTASPIGDSNDYLMAAMKIAE